MTEVYFTSDLHLQHRLVAGHRGFGEDVDAHDASIAKDWDARVRPDGTVWVLGDLIASARWTDYAMEWIARRPGRKHLIAGNHDGCHPMHRGWTKEVRRWLEVFETVSSLGSVRIEGQKVLLSHFPYGTEPDADRGEVRYPEWRPVNTGRWLAHGHTHMANQFVHGRQLHVGWDRHRGLVSLHELAKVIREG